MHACSEQVQGQASKPSDGGDLEGEGREGTASEGGEASARGERAAEAGKAGKGGKEAKELDRSKSSRCWSRPGPAETDRPASAAPRFNAHLDGDGGTNKTTLSKERKRGAPSSPWLAGETRALSSSQNSSRSTSSATRGPPTQRQEIRRRKRQEQ